MVKEQKINQKDNVLRTEGAHNTVLLWRSVLAYRLYESFIIALFTVLYTCSGFVNVVTTLGILLVKERKNKHWLKNKSSWNIKQLFALYEFTFTMKRQWLCILSHLYLASAPEAAIALIPVPSKDFWTSAVNCKGFFPVGHGYWFYCGIVVFILSCLPLCSSWF